MPSPSRYSTECRISPTVRPNLPLIPDEPAQRPTPGAASLVRTPKLGSMRCTRDASLIRRSSWACSATGMMLRPILAARTAVSMYSASLKPLQTSGIPLRRWVSASPAMSSGLEPTSMPNPISSPYSQMTSQTCRSWLTLIG